MVSTVMVRRFKVSIRVLKVNRLGLMSLGLRFNWVVDLGFGLNGFW